MSDMAIYRLRPTQRKFRSMDKPRNHRYEALWWSIELPEEWSVRDYPQCTEFKSINSKGTLQLSGYRQDWDIGEGELSALAGEEPTTESIKLGVFGGLCCSHDSEGTRWKKWWLTKERTLIFATYSGPVHSADSELAAVEELLKTLEVRPKLS